MKNKLCLILISLAICLTCNEKPKNGFMAYQGWMNYGDYVAWMDTDFKMHIFIPEFYQFKLLYGNQPIDFQKCGMNWQHFDSWWIMTDNSPFVVDRYFKPVNISVLQLIKEESK